MNTSFFWDTVLVVTGMTIGTAIIALIWQRSFFATSNKSQFLLLLLGIIAIIASIIALDNTERTVFHFAPLALVGLLFILIPAMAHKGTKESHMKLYRRGNDYLSSVRKNDKNDDDQDIVQSMKLQGKNDSLAA